MKIKIIISTLVFFLFSAAGFAQSEIKIKTSAECEMCKKKLEGSIIYEKGVKFARLNLTDKMLTVEYNPKKTSPEEIKNAVSKLGYDADELKADSIAYMNLPECCRKPGMHHAE